MLTWRQAWPDWYKYELDMLNHHGYVYRIDEDNIDSDLLILNLEYHYNSELLHLKIIFPPEYPFFPPEVSVDNKSLARHRGGLKNTFCLFGHDQNNDVDWMPFEDTLATTVLNEQVPKVLAISDAVEAGHGDSEWIAEDEAHVGEALTTYLAGHVEGCLLVGDWMIPNDIKHGRFDLKIRVDVNQEEAFIRGFIYQIYDNKTPLSCDSVTCIPNSFESFDVYNCPWIRAELLSSIDTKEKLWEWFQKHHSAKARRIIDMASKKGFSAAGLLINEEIDHRKYDESWLFLIAYKSPSGIRRMVLRGLRASDKELKQRVPELAPLANKKIAIIGLGSVGSPIAIHLAKAGASELFLVDNDIVEPGNTVRWALGMHAVGMDKATALIRYLNDCYPLTQTGGFKYKVGSVKKPDIHETFINRLKEMDLVIDATASIGVNQYLAHLCQVNKVPYHWCSTTEGGWGGIIGRIQPDVTQGCWSGYFRKLDKEFDLPVKLDTGNIVPAGCFTPTFTGAGIDCEQIGLFSARLAISTLCEGEENAYPVFDWDIGIVNFRDIELSTAIAPSWKTYQLICESDCVCRSKE